MAFKITLPFPETVDDRVARRELAFDITHSDCVDPDCLSCFIAVMLWVKQRHYAQDMGALSVNAIVGVFNGGGGQNLPHPSPIILHCRPISE